MEIVPQAIEDAKSNAALNGITNASFFVGKAEEVLPEFYEKESRKPDADMLHPDVIVVDPPGRDAMRSAWRRCFVWNRTASCMSAAIRQRLQRDLKILCGGRLCTSESASGGSVWAHDTLSA